MNAKSEVASHTPHVYGDPISIYTNDTSSEASTAQDKSRTEKTAPSVIKSTPSAITIALTVSFFVSLMIKYSE